jgi:uncharacterized protein YegP (UPF0339 family)
MRLTQLAALIVVLSGLAFAPGMFTARAQPEEKPATAKATFEVYKDHGGEYRWRLRTRNTQVIATSGDGYKEKQSCLDAIESVKRNAADAPVKEME